MAFGTGPNVALADYKAADPTGVPAKLAQGEPIERGEYLARAADCMVCHTAAGGKEYAGGLGFKLPFGTLYSTNITPDKETGIGNYSDRDFLNAVQRGIRHDGARLYPAMPYTSYTYITDADALAIKAYLFSLPPVQRDAAGQHAGISVQPALGHDLLVGAVQSGYAFRAGHLENGRNGIAAPISPKRWRIAANAIRRAIWPSRSTTARNSQARSTAGWRAFNISSDKATGVGGWRDEDLRLSRDRACRTDTAPPRARWAKRSTTVSASWRRKTSAPWWRICAPCRRSPRPICRRRWRRRRPHRTRRAAATRMRAARWCSKAPASVATAGPAKARSRLRHAHGRLGGQRSRRNKCRANRHFRHHAA